MESPLPPYKPDPAEAPASPAPRPLITAPSPRRQSWGAVISMVIIVLMIVVGAFYAWGKRIAQERAVQEAASSTAR
ncbi:MAG TPA: hypothetical protein VHC68_00120 [Candidatus Paceibacterota bacterium]|nr:hypothetical protein [Candidatus Paceibacterota bacterium]